MDTKTEKQLLQNVADGVVGALAAAALDSAFVPGAKLTNPTRLIPDTVIMIGSDFISGFVRNALTKVLSQNQMVELGDVFETLVATISISILTLLENRLLMRKQKAMTLYTPTTG